MNELQIPLDLKQTKPQSLRKTYQQARQLLKPVNYSTINTQQNLNINQDQKLPTFTSLTDKKLQNQTQSPYQNLGNKYLKKRQIRSHTNPEKTPQSPNKKDIKNGISPYSLLKSIEKNQNNIKENTSFLRNYKSQFPVDEQRFPTESSEKQQQEYQNPKKLKLKPLIPKLHNLKKTEQQIKQKSYTIHNFQQKDSDYLRNTINFVNKKNENLKFQIDKQKKTLDLNTTAIKFIEKVERPKYLDRFNRYEEIMSPEYTSLSAQKPTQQQFNFIYEKDRNSLSVKKLEKMYHMTKNSFYVQKQPQPYKYEVIKLHRVPQSPRAQKQLQTLQNFRLNKVKSQQDSDNNIKNVNPEDFLQNSYFAQRIQYEKLSSKKVTTSNYNNNMNQIRQQFSNQKINENMNSIYQIGNLKIQLKDNEDPNYTLPEFHQQD